ncbi:threonine--tRNA ligase [Campylobacter sp. CCUG 57310]|uniref:threonine--tRNA ligase n=1 Tax=Campylobacter sp. CCUG 57310 TaxID=2517362 RepID=UPI001564D188|nr:threonine--tRNA ligase [Campylobacter sp. CCUG 57310]QKF93066.1 threonyl-tRNA synthetase [Campylobacter sp. CCUG 57310]
MSDIIAYKLNGEIVDTQSIKDLNSAEPIYFDNSKEALSVIRHSCAHLMAEAIKSLHPEAKFFVGPAIEDGFYYDFRVDSKIGEADLEAIEAKMKELIEAKKDIEKTCFTKKEISDRFINDDLKQEVLKRIPDGEVTMYSQGIFEDICRGPHVPNTKFLRFFKLTRVAGAYLGGDETREMLTRIYGTAYADKESLKEHIRIIEEAKKRDHRKLGTEMKLFTFDEEVGGGLPIWLPNGGRLRSKLEQILYKAHRDRGYEPVRGPELLKADVWKKSGHYTNYKENMYFTTIDDAEYGIKPMNCVGHIKVYQSEIRSYRDLPVKFFEYGVVHRHEKSGVLHGLFRVREFAQDDSHIFCSPDQIKENILEILAFAGKIMENFGFEYEMEISTKPAKAIGDDEIWDIATKALKEALDENGFKYGIDEGGGAFYGPKIDIKITDALKRKWQCGTIQVDFNLPERFDLGYIDSNNERKRPVMLHRALLGSFERFIGILIEHTSGELPFFIAPTQVVIVPINDSHLDYAKQVAKELRKINVDSEISSKNESLNKRIRSAEKQRVPMIVVIGDNEAQNRSIALRDRHNREQKDMKLEEFIILLKEKLSEVHF